MCKTARIKACKVFHNLKNLLQIGKNVTILDFAAIVAMKIDHGLLKRNLLIFYVFLKLFLKVFFPFDCLKIYISQIDLKMQDH